uniref:NADH dehydrogenase subunit 6 n=1 Tax=Protostrongylus rufescens TaxID=321386 RepID=A0A059SEK1_PRORF|nr:NADH dehydrogenase subunit 6 [Protostrongylus rufescens]AGW80387.1 NADH dehydrogenase subunit 6 [Protostrongylus rufescens]
MGLLCLGFCLMSYINNDPIKSCFYLIMSMLVLMPLMSFANYSWFSYFVSMLFLSGIFVILVYFSSMSSFMKFNSDLKVLGFLVSVMLLLSLGLFGKNLLMVLSVFYYDSNICLLMYLVLVLLIFMNYVSYFLSFSGALRSV